MNSYEELKSWLKNDLGHITDMKQLAIYCRDFMQKMKGRTSKDQVFTKSVINPLQIILSTIGNKALTKDEKINTANKLLINIFANSFFRKEHYEKRSNDLKNTTNYESEIVSRLKSMNPLVTLDGAGAFKNDPRNLSQIERATTLIFATINVFTQLKNEKKASYGNVLLNWNDHGAYFGRTVVTTDNGNTIHSAPHSKHITILVNGQAYYLPLIDDQDKTISIESIKANLKAIISDFQNEGHGGSLGSITAAPRKLCHETRKKLENRGKNASLFRLIDESLFIICLDQGEDLTNDREKRIKRVFTNFTNRWYGTSQITIGPNGEAGLINSYIRGDNNSSGVPLFDTIVDIAFTLPISNKSSTGKPQFKKLAFDIKEDDLSQLVEATKPYFHTQQSLFDLDIGISFFVKLGIHPNAAVQLLVMLAAREIDPQKKLPIFKQALSVNDTESTGSSLDWTFIPTHKINKFVTEVDKKELHNDELFNLFKDAVSTHTETIKKTREGWSPTFCLRKPEGELYDELCKFFITIGNQLEGGYAGYLFRPTRLPGSMDIMTSFHKLSKNFILVGRPGGTMEAVSKFGAHIAFSRNKLEFSWMPNVSSKIDLLELNSSLRKWISYIDEIST